MTQYNVVSLNLSTKTVVKCSMNGKYLFIKLHHHFINYTSLSTEPLCLRDCLIQKFRSNLFQTCSSLLLSGDCGGNLST